MRVTYVLMTHACDQTVRHSQNCLAAKPQNHEIEMYAAISRLERPQSQAKPLSFPGHPEHCPHSAVPWVACPPPALRRMCTARPAPVVSVTGCCEMSGFMLGLRPPLFPVPSSPVGARCTAPWLAATAARLAACRVAPFPLRPQGTMPAPRLAATLSASPRSTGGPL